MTTHFNPNRNHVRVLVKIAGPSNETIARMALDTGATRTSIDRQIAVFLGFEFTDDSETVRVATGSGYEVIPVVDAHYIKALGHYREDLPVLCQTLPSDLPIDGLLGLDFFRNQRLTIDFREGTISLD